MRVRLNSFIAMVVVILASFSIAVASSNTSNTFKTGPFTVSVNLGMPCNDINISKPDQVETLSGDSYTDYTINACQCIIYFLRYDTPQNWRDDFGTDVIQEVLIKAGADRDTINVYDRTIDGKSGAVGSGYIPKNDNQLYYAGFFVSPKSLGYIYIWDNQTEMISALKTIHVTENA